MKEYFEKVYIKTEDDLPEKVGNYFVQLTNGHGQILHFPFKGDVGWKVDEYNWLDTVEYYLRPIEHDCYPKEFVEWLLGKSNIVYDIKNNEWITTAKSAFTYWKKEVRK
jgi:hypothetical protein